MTPSTRRRGSVPLDRAAKALHATLSTAPERPRPHRLPHPLDHGRTHPPSEASSLLDSFLCEPEPDDLAEQERVLTGLEARLFGNAASVTLSRYVLLRRLGAGSHGVVYEGYDPELDRKVAIKLVRTQGMREAYRQRARMRLLREAQAMAHVSHPNVITVHDLGTYDAVLGDDVQGKPDRAPPGRTRGVFLVMELLEGGTLADWLPAGPHPWRAVLDVFVAAGRGLAAAHGIGLVHRDFKPANVLLAGNGRVCVADFGLARARAGTTAAADEHATFSRDSVVSLPLTGTGLALGTPAYMAPEQHAGIPCDARSDQYSFCVALYEALHGRRPFPQSDLDALRLAKRTNAPAPRSRQVPAWLHRLVLRGLDPDPDRRHPSMNALVEALERGRARRRRRAGVLTAAVVGLVALLGATRTPPGSSCAAGAGLEGIWDPPAQRQVQAAFAASARAQGIPTWRTVSNALDRYAADWLDARAATCEHEAHAPAGMAEQQRHCLARRRERLAALTALLRQADDGVIAHALDLLAALPDIAPCRGDLSGHLDGMPATGPLQAQVEAVARDIARAELLWRAGKHAPAQAIIDAAASRSRALAHGAVTAEALRIQALLAWAAGDARTAEAHLRDAIRMSETAGAHAQAAEALIELIRVLGQEPAPGSAGTQPDAPDQAPGLARERVTEAVHLADMALARIDYLGLGEHHRARLALYSSLAEARLGAPARAAAPLRAAIDHYRQAHPDPVLLGQMYVLLGDLCQAQGERHEADAAWQRAVDVYRAAGGPSHPRLTEPLSRLGAAAAAPGRFAQDPVQHAVGTGIPTHP